MPWCLDPLGGALLRPEWVQQKAVRGRMEICGLCPFNFAMAWCFQSQVAWEISSHGTPVSESWSVLHLAVMALFIACTALGQVCDEFVLARHHTRVYPSRLDHSSFGDLCFLRSMHCIVTNGQARLTSSLYDWQTRQDTLPSGEAVGLHRLSLWGGIRQPFSTLDILLFLVSDGPKRHFFLGCFKFTWPTLALLVVNDL